MNNLMVTLTGPSCSGKTTLETLLKAKGFTGLISTTTRPQRVGEVNGHAYYFTSRMDFLTSLGNEEFVESVEFNGNLYAVSKAEIQRVSKLGLPVVLIVEPTGLVQIRDYMAMHDYPVVSYFIDSPFEVVAERFLTRFAADILNCPDLADATTKTYASRLETIVGVEQEWRHGVVGILDGAYDHVIEAFNEGNTQQIVDSIVAVAYQPLKAAA